MSTTTDHLTTCTLCVSEMFVRNARGFSVAHECIERAGVTGGPGAWRAVIRVGRKVVWEGQFTHRNRDQSGFNAGPSALNFATEELRERQTPGARDFHRQCGHTPILDTLTAAAKRARKWA